MPPGKHASEFAAGPGSRDQVPEPAERMRIFDAVFAPTGVRIVGILREQVDGEAECDAGAFEWSIAAGARRLSGD